MMNVNPNQKQNNLEIIHTPPRLNILNTFFNLSLSQVWDMVSPTEINLRRVLVGHRAAVNVVDFDDKYIVSASGDRTIKVSI